MYGKEQAGEWKAMEEQQGTWTQLKLFEAEDKNVRQGESGEG